LFTPLRADKRSEDGAVGCFIYGSSFQGKEERSWADNEPPSAGRRGRPLLRNPFLSEDAPNVY